MLFWVISVPSLFQPSSKATPATLSTVLTFGQYKGETIQDVMKHDASYLIWAVENIDWFDIDVVVMEVIEDAAFEQSEEESYYLDDDMYSDDPGSPRY